MSFRRRLILFFVLIVVLPIGTAALLVTHVADDLRTGKADAGLAASMEAALSLFQRHVDVAGKAAHAAGRDEALAIALRSEDQRAARDALDRLAGELGVAGLSARSTSGDLLARAGSREAVAVSEVLVRGPEGRLGRVRAAALRPHGLAAEVAALTGRDVVVLRGPKTLDATVEVAAEALPSDGVADVSVPGGDLRASTVTPQAAEPELRIALLSPRPTGGLAASNPLVVIGALGFVAIAVLFVVLLVRALQGQVHEMFAAARRVGGGDFSHRVPVEGNDEMAGLAREFNTMSERLSEQMTELRGHRAELERSVKRIGEAFAAGLDQSAVLEIAAETALAACGAGVARVVSAEPGRNLEAQAGERPPGALDEAMREAEHGALRDGVPTDAVREPARALAQPLRGVAGGRAHGTIAIARSGRAFDAAQREMLRYLASQTAVSIENIELHELVSEGAVTDELTGLSNSRRFRELVADEIERAERFGHELSLVLIEIDDLPEVIRAHGQAQADEVLREVARILKRDSRSVDELARYGDEEFVAGLPETGPAGALQFAERVRARIEQSAVPLLDGSGMLRVTASLGVATAPGSAGDVRGLVSAARAALGRSREAGSHGSRVGVADRPRAR